MTGRPAPLSSSARRVRVALVGGVVLALGACEPAPCSRQGGAEDLGSGLWVEAYETESASEFESVAHYDRLCLRDQNLGGVDRSTVTLSPSGRHAFYDDSARFRVVDTADGTVHVLHDWSPGTPVGPAVGAEWVGDRAVRVRYVRLTERGLRAGAEPLHGERTFSF